MCVCVYCGLSWPNVIWCVVICGLGFAPKYSCLWCLVYDNVRAVQALRPDYLERCCHLVFGLINKMHYVVCVLRHVSVQPVCSAVINDSRGERTSAVSPFWLFWADLVLTGRSGHNASGDLKILGHSLTCTSASAPQEHFHSLGEGNTVSTQGHTFSHRERTFTVRSRSSPPLCKI